MAESTPDDPSDDDTTRPPAEAEIGAAVDDALQAEVKRQKARFVQQIMGLDRIEGVGRRDERWNEGFDRHHEGDRPDDPEA